MSSLWAALQGQEKSATAVVNDDLVVAEDPARGAPIRAGKRSNFKPVDPAIFERQFVNEDGEEVLVLKQIKFIPDSAKAPPKDDFMDLVTDSAPPYRGPAAGRPRHYADNAARQKAWRERQKLKPKRK